MPQAERPQTQAWQQDDAGERWRQSQASRNQFLAAATNLMLDMVALRPGHRVLDVAAGTGDQSIEAARRVGPTGYVLATDLSASMVAMAAKAAAEAGLRNIETRAVDAQHLEVEPGSFDAAICRAGLMFIPDRQKALERIRHALKHGGRFAAVVWSSEEKNPAVMLPLSAVEPRLGADTPPLMRIGLSMGEPGVLEDALTAAGFQEVTVQAVAADRHASSVAEALADMRNGPASTTVNQLPEAEREAAWQEIAARLRGFQGPDGVHIPGELLVGVGTSP